jgi:hypothetical protein
MGSLALPMVLSAAGMAFVRWRYGLYLAVLVAILQDPLRKITPGQPVIFIVFAALVFGAACLGAVSAKVSLLPNSIQGWKQSLGVPFGAFVAIIGVQALHSFVVYGNLIMSMIGLFSYLTPFPALVFTYQLAARGGAQSITRYYSFYLACVTVALLTVYIEFSGVQSPMLGEVGQGITIYGATGVMRANCGTFRASEIAAWHSSAAACLFFLVTAGRKTSIPNLALAALYIAFALVIGALTGRRKMAVVVTIFICSHFALTAFLVRGAAKTAIGVGLAALIGYSALGSMSGTDARSLQAPVSEYNAYIGRNQSVLGDSGERFMELGLGPVMWAYTRFGVMGAGLGTGSQGAQHFGGGAGEFGGAGEGGLGKITMELGIPGLFIAGWFGVAFALYIWRSVRLVARTSKALTPLMCSLLSFLIANVASFTVATQAFGDLFILLTLGITLGFLLALPVLAARTAPGANQATARAPQPILGSRW